MKSIKELHEIAKNALQAAGFEQFGKGINASDGEIYNRRYAKENDAHNDPMAGLSFTHLNGKSIDVETVYRSNGTDENRSIRIMAIGWHNSSGRATYIGKIYGKNGDKKIASIIAEAIAAYDKI